ncbi:MAG: carboxypeptidase-like regulatory domain-containing protein, partial [Sphingobacterium sp.]|nr:carboxypeptidase-like regulatory domain-containing protein [Sphingobacterium sp.]
MIFTAYHRKFKWSANAFSLTFLFFALLLVIPEGASAQQKRISGKVIDASTKKAIPGVSVKLTGQAAGASTNDQGA